jgi:GTP-binding protein HflX
LTDAGVRAADQLFATLDTTTRRVRTSNRTPVVLSDTVGFIRHLPHTLVAAFRATLEETVHADLLLHVVDASGEDREAQILAVNEVLAEIGADAIPQVLVLNKIDLTRFEPRVERDQCGKISRVWLSAETGSGLDSVRLALEEHASAALTSARDERPAAA